jgi:hypothetical protein
MFVMALFLNLDPIFLTPLRSLPVYNAMMTNFITRLDEFRFAIINSLISTRLKLAKLQACIIPNDDVEK